MRAFLFIVLATALVLRVVGLDKVPPELFGDEVDVGYHSYSLLKTGRDYYGQFLPTYIHSLSEWRTPLLMYVSAPFVGIFGLNEWGVRLPSAVFGVVAIFLLYALVKLLAGDRKVAILAGLMLAISPWHLQYSRAAFEVSLLLVLLLGGALAFLKGLKKTSWLFASGALFALTLYTYSTAVLFTPLLIALLILINKRELVTLPRKRTLGAALLFALMFLPIAYNVLFGFAAERYGRFSVFTDEQVVGMVNRKRLEAGGGLLETAVHNKPIVWGRNIAANYARAFSPQFLFISGDPIFRHSIQEIGELYWIQLPLLLLGLFLMVKRKDRASKLWLGWLLLAPIPAALTVDAAHATRLILMLPPLAVASAVGINGLIKWKSYFKKIVLVLVSLVLLVEFGLYLHRYWVHYPKESWRWWHTGYKEAMLFMKQNEGDYELVVFNNSYEPSLIRFLFWWGYPPERFLNEFEEDKAKEEILAGFNGFSLEDKYYFGTVSEGREVLKFVRPGMLYLVSQRDEVPGDWDWEKNPPDELRVLRTVRNPYGEPIFYVVTGL